MPETQMGQFRPRLIDPPEGEKSVNGSYTPLAVRRWFRPYRSLSGAYLVGITGYAGGLFLSALLDLPAGAVIVWTLMVAAELTS